MSISKGFQKRAYNQYQGGMSASYGQGGTQPADSNVRDYTIGGITGAALAAKGSQKYQKSKAVREARGAQKQIRNLENPGLLGKAFGNKQEMANKASLLRAKRDAAMREAKKHKTVPSSVKETLTRGFNKAKDAVPKDTGWTPKSYFSKIKPLAKRLLK